MTRGHNLVFLHEDGGHFGGTFTELSTTQKFYHNERFFFFFFRSAVLKVWPRTPAGPEIRSGGPQS